MNIFDYDFKTRISASLFYSRLEDKTQMIRNNEGCKDYFERSIHTSDVCKCSLAISSRLSTLTLDKNVIISMALLHDIGHTPFGHAGEEAINEMFISNDGKHYSETYPGLFKHNINSLRIIGDYLNDFTESFALMDGILKHTSPFPKGYCLTVFKEENIIKSNFILRYFNSAIEGNIGDFLNLTENLVNCASKTKACLANYRFCRVCLKNVSTSLCFDKSNKEMQLSAYVCYPYALTYEGSILFLADEISCFCSDLLDFFVFVKNNEKKIYSFIPLTKLNSCIAVVKTIYQENQLVEPLKEFMQLLYNPKKNDKTAAAAIIQQIKTILFDSVVVNPNIFESGSLKICFDGTECKPLLTLSSNLMNIIHTIKQSIYQDLHSIEKIKYDNDEGKQTIRMLIEHYYSHFEDFLVDFKKYNLKSATKMIALAIAKVASLDYKKVLLWFKKGNEEKLKICCLLEGESLLDDDLKDETKFVLVKNVVKREIGYFVASLSEKQCFQLKTAYDTNLNKQNT